MVSRLLSGSKDHGKIFVCDNAVSRMNFRDISSSVSRNRNTTRRNFLVPVVLADEAAFDVEFQLVPAEPDVRPRRQIAAVPVLLQPLENSGQKVFLVLADGEQVGNPQRMGKIPPPRRSTLYACMLISVNSPSGVSSMQATETRLSVSHTAGTCIPAACYGGRDEISF